MESETLGRLIDQHAAALELFARQWVDQPEDVVQEAFVRLAGLPIQPSNPRAWLFRTVRNGAINAGVKQRRRRRYETEVATPVSAWFEIKSLGQKEAAVDAESAQAALAALSPDQREIIVAHIWGGLTFDEIAQMAGHSASTAHRIYQAGLTCLRERLGVPCRTNSSRTIPK